MLLLLKEGSSGRYPTVPRSQSSPRSPGWEKLVSFSHKKFVTHIYLDRLLSQSAPSELPWLVAGTQMCKTIEQLSGGMNGWQCHCCYFGVYFWKGGFCSFWWADEGQLLGLQLLLHNSWMLFLFLFRHNIILQILSHDHIWRFQSVDNVQQIFRIIKITKDKISQCTSTKTCTA